ncbi:MAG: pitrilysin family protein [Candidatus Kapabacteria bacterium]|nr:pitrilysin family protein [Candidatus Kapabacteria bacterium]
MPWMPPTDITLPNGIRVLCDPVTTVDSCSVGVWVRAGTRDEPKKGDGVAHFVEHTSFRRTTSRTMSKISRDFENVGAYVNAYTTKEETCYYVRTLSDHVERVVDTLIDVVVRPVFDDADVEKERTIITEEIRSYEDEAEEYIFDLGERQVFDGHALGIPIVGTTQSVAKITSANVRAFHDRHYHAGSIVVAVSGRVDIDEFVRSVERLTSDVRRKRPLIKRTTPSLLPRSTVVVHRPVQQAHLLWQRRTPGYMHKDKYVLQLLNVVLGDGMSSRLNVRLRESRGLAYSVYSQVQLFSDCGTMAIYVGVDEHKIDKVNAIITHALDEISRDGIKRSELQRAITQLRSGKLMSLESLTSRMTMLGKGVMEEGAPENPYETIADIERVTLDGVARVASILCDASMWSTCTIMPTTED